MSIAIEVENLSKAYKLGQFNTGALAHDLKRWWALKRGKEDPFLTVGEINDRATKGLSDIVWSLRDINFKIGQGDALGIIGRNGAGKSTLLKLLSSITSPTKGEIRINGRIASLLEVGTGFHPELTGRENIFLNGAILGMKKAEIKQKFDEIVDFSGVERYIDTPVKRYSSGMYVRLAFAVAAHLESEILIVDEVLAVGDAEFQKKCLGKMSDVSKGGGRTVLFVSHNMSAISQLCNYGLVIHNGQLEYYGSTSVAIERYLNSNQNLNVYDKSGFIDLLTAKRTVGKAKIFKGIRFLDRFGVVSETFDASSTLKIEVALNQYEEYKGMDYAVNIYSSSMQRLTSFATWMNIENIKSPEKITLHIPKIPFCTGTYIISLSVTHPKEGGYIDKIENAAYFNVEALDLFHTGRDFTSEYGLIIPEGTLVLE